MICATLQAGKSKNREIQIGFWFQTLNLCLKIGLWRRTDGPARFLENIGSRWSRGFVAIIFGLLCKGPDST